MRSIRQALVAPTIDAGAIEKLRQDNLALMDKRSALFTQGLVASAQVLTPDQRQKVADEIQKHAGEHRHEGDDAHHFEQREAGLRRPTPARCAPVAA